MTEQQRRPDVLCVGSMGKDLFLPLRTEQSAPRAARLCFMLGDKVHIHDRYTAPGGCACNVSVGLARLGVRAAALGIIGDDADGAWIVRQLRDNGVDTDGVSARRDANTDLSVIIVDAQSGDRTIFVNRDVGEHLTLASEHIVGVPWCFAGSLYGENVASNMAALRDAALSGRTRLAYNPGMYNIDEQPDRVVQLLRVATGVFVNKSEAAKIAAIGAGDDVAVPTDEAALIAALLAKMTSPEAFVVMTDGTRGAWTNDAKGATLHVAASGKAARDTTGAGDAFASGFLAALLRGNDRAQCMQWGAANSDGVIEYYGAQKGLLTYDIMERRAGVFRMV